MTTPLVLTERVPGSAFLGRLPPGLDAPPVTLIEEFVPRFVALPRSEPAE